MKFSELCKDFWHNFYELKNNVESHTGVLTGIGVVAGLAGTVLACRATLKIANKAEEHKQLVDTTKDNCALAGMDEKETKKEVMKVYRRIGVDYVKKYWPAVGLIVVGYGLIFRAHTIEVAKNEALMSAYIGLEQFVNKYRAKVAEEVGAEKEQELYTKAQAECAEQNVIGEYAGEFRDGSYMLMNESCADYSKGCPQSNLFDAQNVQEVIKMKFATGETVYVNDVMRAFGHPEIAGGWSWIWRKGLTDCPNFRLTDPAFNPEFSKGYGFSTNGEEPILRVFLNGCVHVSKMYTAEYRQYLREDKADGGIMGGKLGQDPVIVG